MSIIIDNSPSKRKDVMSVAKCMKYEDFEYLALCIEWFRSGGKTRSESKVTGRVLYDAICFAEEGKEIP